MKTQNLISFKSDGALVSSTLALFTENGRPFQWHSAERAVAFEELRVGYEIANENNLTRQILNYREKAIDLAYLDIAEVAREAAFEACQYRRDIFKAPDFPIEPGTREHIRSATLNGRRFTEGWIYNPAKSYNSMIPPRALVALSNMKHRGIRCDPMWVATLEQTSEARNPIPIERPDPLLCISFGPYIVAIAEWK